MIALTRLNHGPFMLNPDLIEHVQMTPDTVVTMTNGDQFRVLESAGEIVERVIAFRREIFSRPWILFRPPQAGEAAAANPDPE